MGDVHNEFAGNATYMVQAGDISGDIVFSAVTDAPLDRAARDLAAMVHAQWRDEAVARGLAGAGKLPVQWVADWSVADHRDNVGAAPAGGLGDLVEALRAMPEQRLAIIGGPGSGKTSLAILLTLELLRGHARAQPVPVIVLASSWNPVKEHFDDWLARRIGEEYLGQGKDLTRDRIRQLVRDRRILPILDGLDEMPDLLLEEALAKLNRMLGDGSPVILTCRAAEYTAAITNRSVLAGATVVRAQPVGTHTAADYLRRTAQPLRLPRWEPVLSELITNPGGPIATAFQSPLMLWLARTVYHSGPHDPAELLDAARFPDALAIDRHLLDALVPAVFPAGPRSPDQPKPIRDWGPSRAQRWLAFLAAHLTHSHSREIAWWRLSRAYPVPLFEVPALVALYFVLVEVMNLFVDWYPSPDAFQSFEIALGSDIAFKLALLGGVVVGLLRLWKSDLPRRPRVRGRLTGIIMAIAVLTVLASFLERGASIVVYAVGVSTVLVVGLGVPMPSAQVLGPRALLRGERASTALTASLAGPVVGAAVAWLLPTSGWAAVSGIWLIGGLAAAVVVVALSPWSQWLLAKAVLAGMGRLPWSVLTFLEDARRAGVLRQVGGVYQFRHAHLQARLASAWTGRQDVVPAPDRDDANELRIHTRSRSPLRPQVIAVLLPVLTVVFMVQSENSLTDAQAWLGTGTLVAVPVLVGWLLTRLVSRKVELHLTSELIEATVGRRTLTFGWDDVAEVAVRPFGRSKDVMLHVRPVSEVELAPWVRVDSAGWIAMYPLGTDGTVPPQLEQALARFAGERWKPLD
ncbi:hypothetical protein GCM10009545_31910 [Saccharopolyspora thermophila]|uniref:NACHT domain-containing protein n=2 Tax=Saccharopolyspora thermophila TaxID=89367 RepID=A0ABN1CVI1_9PSEU